MIYITGPPDNGYKATLYAVLQHLNASNKKIISLEGSMSRIIDGVTQVPVRFDLGQTYATAIRSILYHNPDVILIEETPDAETESVPRYQVVSLWIRRGHGTCSRHWSRLWLPI